MKFVQLCGLLFSMSLIGVAFADVRRYQKSHIENDFQAPSKSESEGEQSQGPCFKPVQRSAATNRFKPAPIKRDRHNRNDFNKDFKAINHGSIQHYGLLVGAITLMTVWFLRIKRTGKLW